MASTIQLRDYQQAAVDAALAHFRASRESACIVLPTGAGKSVVIAELARLAKGRVLALSHVKELCEQNAEKQRALGVEAGIFSAGLGEKATTHRVTHGSIQSVARNLDAFTEPVSLLVIDECHRVSGAEGTEYERVIATLRERNPRLSVLGFTATPYRLGLGYVYERHVSGVVRADEPRPFARCIYEVRLGELVERGFLARPRLENAAVSGYDFSALPRGAGGVPPNDELNRLLGKTKRVTEAIVRDVVARAERDARRGVMLFAATVEHAKEILGYLPPGEAGLVVGETAMDERDRLIAEFKAEKLRYLANVSVLTTGFDAPHVDLIAVLRPTESVALFQQMLGRGLRLAPGKRDCLLVDYAGNGYRLDTAEVVEAKPSGDAEPVKVPCPSCGGENWFWGKVDADGDVVEHFGRRCRCLVEGENGETRCEYRFRFKECECGAENDIAARRCHACDKVLVDPDDRLKAALGLRGSIVLRVSGTTYEARGTKLVLTHHDEDGATLVESFDFAAPAQKRAFFAIFGRRADQGRRPVRPESAEQARALSSLFPSPDFVIATVDKRTKARRITERLFDYEGRYRKANEER